MFRAVIMIMLVMTLGVYLRNASWLASEMEGQTQIIAHRGIHQTYDRQGLTNETCTASRIYTPTHHYLENTLPSMQVAFQAGAQIVELDIHPTTDGHHAVFHDWTVECRTEGKGRTRDHTLATLKSLDIGYGYTSDGGKSYPFRGSGVGLMPSFKEVMTAFPRGKFLVNLKSNDSASGLQFVAALDANPSWTKQIWAIYGGPEAINVVSQRYPNIRTFDRVTTKKCLKSYLMRGWSGYVPKACCNTVIMLPISHRSLAWGWPNAFMARMAAVETDVVLLGPYENGDPGTTGIDQVDLLAKVPRGYSGYIWTNKVELIGPAAN